MHIQTILQNYGLSEKEVAVYTALIELGPSPVRLIAQKSKVNRGTTYDILRSLMEDGLVVYYHKETKQYFVAEPPDKLLAALESKQARLHELKEKVKLELPELRSLYERKGGKPQVRMYEGLSGIRQILEDVLKTVGVSKDKMYYVYSASTVRKNVYMAMPDHGVKRVKQKIRVRTISLGSGGQLIGLDERKWLESPAKNQQATYEIIYKGKVAHISLDDTENPTGVVIENSAIYETQKIIFQTLWQTL
jgi:HTH-type transcriptional regulator, sugar sensing transcriptional regulator